MKIFSVSMLFLDSKSYAYRNMHMQINSISRELAENIAFNELRNKHPDVAPVDVGISIMEIIPLDS